MRLPYDKIFLDGGGEGDSEIVACGFSASYMRLLLSAAGDYFSFYDGEDRVELSDTENQIIESGREELTRFFIEGGCSNVKVVFTGTLPNGQVVTPNNTSSIFLTPGTLESEYLSWDTQTARMTFNKDGVYLFQCAVRVNANTTPAGQFRHILYATNENGDSFDSDERTRVGSFETCRLTLCMFRAATRGFGLKYFHSHAFNVELFTTHSFLRVVHLG